MNISNNFLRDLIGDEVYPKELINVLKKHTKKDRDGVVKVDKDGKVQVNKKAAVNELMKNPSRLATLIQYIKKEGNEDLLKKISTDLYKMDLKDLKKPGLKQLEITLRNRGLLNRTTHANFVLKDEKGKVGEVGHKSILALESPYFKALQEFRNLQGKTGKQILMEKDLEEMGIPPKAYKFVMDYLYTSDMEREKLISTIDKNSLVVIAILADLWQIKTLATGCDEELCNALLEGEIGIEKDDLKNWQDLNHILPKFTNMVKYTIMEGEGDPLVGYFLLNKSTDLKEYKSMDDFIRQMQIKTELAMNPGLHPSVDDRQMPIPGMLAMNKVFQRIINIYTDRGFTFYGPDSELVHKFLEK